jgi:hypothetical protein
MSTADSLAQLLEPDVDQWLEMRNQPTRQLDEGSDLARDAAATSPYYGWHIAATSLGVAVAYLDTFRFQLAGARLHIHPPVALLRGALESSARAVWMVAPDDPRERQTRALQAWYTDLADRHWYEKRTRWQPPRERGRRATQRQAEIRQLAIDLRLPSSVKALTRTTTSVIQAAAEGVSYPSSEAARLWSLSSGLAHGRYWPALVGDLEIESAAETGEDTVQIAYVVPDWLLWGLAALCHRFTTAGHALLEKRSRS